jgi:hypothetical protein
MVNRSLGVAIGVVGASLFFTIRYTEIFYYGIGGIVVGGLLFLYVMYATRFQR